MILVIVDGFGVGPKERGNAIENANTPTWDNLRTTYPHTTLRASGNDVGLPDGVMGNSEVGHLTIGTGRIVFQSLERINQAIREGTLRQKQEINLLIDHLKTTKGNLHLMGLLSDGQVHSDQRHLEALINIFHANALNIWIHCFTDGRDTPVDSSVGYIRRLQNYIKNYDNVTIATVVGRYYVMDRDKKWKRTKRAYDMLVHGEGENTKDIIETIERRYENNETDEFLKPIIAAKQGKIEDGDGILFFNFRPDRARQITQAINYQVPFKTKAFQNLVYVTMTEYNKEWDLPVVFESKVIKNSIAEILSHVGINQMHIAETEKYAHVTYFLNGGREDPFPGEKRILIPSLKIETYDLQPEMSTPRITTKTVESIASNDYPFIVINIACPDMVGHTGNYKATLKAVEAMDEAFNQIYNASQGSNYVMLITADHGNAEKMYDGDSIHTAHTTNPVPFLITKNDLQLRKGGGLKDVSPTVLDIMDIPCPDDMTGKSLIK